MKFFLFLSVALSINLSFAQAPAPAGQAGAGVSENQVPKTGSAQTEQNSLFDIVPQVEYVYDPTGKKDPFKPYRAPRVRGDNIQSAPIDPLILADLAEFKLVAILWNTPKPRALVQDKTGKSYTIQRNTRIGRNEGVVVDIRESEVIVVEKFDDGFGNIVKEARTMEMKP